MGEIISLVGWLMDVVAWIWITIIAWRMGGILWGIGSLITGGLVGIVFGVINWNRIKTWVPFALFIGSLVLIYIVAPLMHG